MTESKKFSSGLSVLELLLAALIVVLLVSGIYTVLQGGQEEKQGRQFDLVVGSQKEEIIKTLFRDDSFYSTIQDSRNAVFECLRMRTNCCPLGVDCTMPLVQPILVSDPQGQLLTTVPAAIAPFSMFDVNGQNCDTDCLFRFELFFRPLCENPCINPTQLEFTGRFSYINPSTAPKGLGAQNPKRFNFKIIRDYYSVPKYLNFTEEVRQTSDPSKTLNSVIKLTITSYKPINPPGSFIVIYQPVDITSFSSNLLDPSINNRVDTRKLKVVLEYNAASGNFSRRLESDMFATPIFLPVSANINSLNTNYETVTITGAGP